MGPALQRHILRGGRRASCRESVAQGRRRGEGTPPLRGETKAFGKRDVGDAAPYGRIIDGAVRRDDVGIVPYGGVHGALCAGRVEPRPYAERESWCKRAVEDAGPYGWARCARWRIAGYRAAG